MLRRRNRFLYGLIVVWPAQWLNIAQSIVGICTLGYYVPSWDINWMCYIGIKTNRWY